MHDLTDKELARHLRKLADVVNFSDEHDSMEVVANAVDVLHEAASRVDYRRSQIQPDKPTGLDDVVGRVEEACGPYDVDLAVIAHPANEMHCWAHDHHLGVVVIDGQTFYKLASFLDHLVFRCLDGERRRS